MHIKVANPKQHTAAARSSKSVDGEYRVGQPFQKESGQDGRLSLQRVLQSAEPIAQRQAAAPNRTGMPDRLKTGLERLSGLDLSHTRVHRNSAKPAQVGAHAYTQGASIYLAPGQERHLAHEAWHVVQQAQGRVQPTGSVNGLPLNDNVGLEREADRMGAQAWYAGS